MASSPALCCSQHVQHVNFQVQRPRLRPAAFRSIRTAHQTLPGCRHQRGVARAAEGEGAPVTEADTEAPSAPPEEAAPGEKVEVPEELQSEGDRKAAEIERLRAAEKFMTKGTGEGECKACGYMYTPKEGDDEYPVPKGTQFQAALFDSICQDLPGDWQCPVCGADKKTFQTRAVTVAGFAENQKYGLGTNSMTEGQKSGLIFGSLAFFFVLFLLGYLFN